MEDFTPQECRIIYAALLEAPDKGPDSDVIMAKLEAIINRQGEPVA